MFNKELKNLRTNLNEAQYPENSSEEYEPKQGARVETVGVAIQKNSTWRASQSLLEDLKERL